jgi:hypothetical protein
MRLFLAFGVLMGVVIAAWLVRLGMGLEHLSQDQVVILLVCGPVGGLAGWYFGSRYVKQLAASGKR